MKRKLILGSLVLLSTINLNAQSSTPKIPAPNVIDSAMYFNADIRDAEYCDISVVNNEVTFGKNVTNPAMTCPDAFSWKLFTDVIQDQFWINWANETENWPAQPWPLCSAKGLKKRKCCDPSSLNNNKSHCPTYPGDTLSNKKHDQESHLTKGNTNSISHAEFVSATNHNAIQFIENNPDLTETGQPRGKGSLQAISASETKATPLCTATQINSFLPDRPQSIGRILRQTNNELTIRNKPFHKYLFDNNLYNSNGVLDVLNNNADNQKKHAPYHLKNVSATKTQTSTLQTVDLPPNAIMIKSNWVSATLVAAIELKYSANPKTIAFGQPKDYIQMPMETVVNKGKNSECKLSGIHYLMSFHISSKDVPQWVWTTFEHINNPGRCDYTGCNDSFGFSQSNGHNQSNFIAPYQKDDGLINPSPVYDIDLQYPAGQQSTALNNMLKALKIGSNKTIHTMPQATDYAWNNYRLKGSQVEFTDHQGRPTLLGNSITEAGFMTNSSCIGCHARATATNIDLVKCINQTAVTSGLSVFEPVQSEFGYQQSISGTPNHGWFYKDDNARTIENLQTDFIWGFLNAKPICPRN